MKYAAGEIVGVRDGVSCQERLAGDGPRALLVAFLFDHCLLACLWSPLLLLPLVIPLPPPLRRRLSNVLAGVASVHRAICSLWWVSG